MVNYDTILQVPERDFSSKAYQHTVETPNAAFIIVKHIRSTLFTWYHSRHSSWVADLVVLRSITTIYPSGTTVGEVYGCRARQIVRRLPVSTPLHMPHRGYPCGRMVICPAWPTSTTCLVKDPTNYLIAHLSLRVTSFVAFISRWNMRTSAEHATLLDRLPRWESIRMSPFSVRSNIYRPCMPCCERCTFLGLRESYGA